MAISIFPSTAAEFVSNNFVVDMNDTSNNTADTGGVKQAGPYSMSFSSGDSSFDVYLIDEDGNSVGYSNNTSIVASGLFSTVVIFGVAQDEIISFLYQGSVNNADGEGDEPGAGAYLESISPSDLPTIDDTATVIGGNFGADTEITFESGATVLPAKSITVVSGTELLVTRPDGLVEDDSPYDLKAINTGVTPPSSIDFVLTDAVTAGSDPTWVTTSPLNNGVPGSAFSQTLEATDSDGTVVDYSVTAGTITPGLTLDSTTGVLSGTPTTGGNFTFTVTATDDGGNTTAKEFEQLIAVALGGTMSSDANFTYHTFTSADDFEVLVSSLNVEYLAIAGGGGGGTSGFQSGGGGAGGLLNGTATISAGTVTATIGAGGGANSNGSSSSFGSIASPTGGGAGGGAFEDPGNNGGSGGGAATQAPNGGNGIVGQGKDGGDSVGNPSGGGGGAGVAGADGGAGGAGGAGLDFSTWASATSTGDSGFYAGGGGAGDNFNTRPGGAGGGGNGNGGAGQANTGGGGGGANSQGGTNPGGPGGSGIIIVRYQ